jgi:hypothetical protein
MAESALRALTQQLMQGGPAPSGMASYQTAIQNAAQRQQQKPVGQQMADVLGGVSLPLSAVPVIGDIAGLGADAAMYANYPEERTALNYGLTLAGMLPFVPGVAGIRTVRDAADTGFKVYHGTPHVLGPNQLVRDAVTGKEYVSDPQMVQAIIDKNPGRYDVIAENPLGIFDANRIGTGEGAQAFGEGFYTTESPDIGRYYRGSLLQRSGVDDTPMIGKQPAFEMYAQIERRAANLPSKVAAKEYDKLSILEQVMIDGDVLGVMQNQDAYSPEAVDWFKKSIVPKFNRPGALYEVEVKAPKTSFLDWDKPVAEQSPQVLERLEKAGIYDPAIENRIALLENEASILAMDRDPVTNAIRNERRWMQAIQERDALRAKQPKNMTGQQAYYAAAPNATSQAEASRVLRELGIEGVSYLDQASRMAGEGSRNYVLFSPQAANITAKYGVTGGAVGLSALRQIAPQQEQE